MPQDLHTTAGATGTILGFFLALIDWSLSASELALLVFVTIPTGILAWYKVGELIHRRRTKRFVPKGSK